MSHAAILSDLIYMQNFLRSDWLRACQLIPNSTERWNWVQKIEIEWKNEIKNDWQL